MTAISGRLHHSEVDEAVNRTPLDIHEDDHPSNSLPLLRGLLLTLFLYRYNTIHLYRY